MARHALPRLKIFEGRNILTAAFSGRPYLGTTDPVLSPMVCMYVWMAKIVDVGIFKLPVGTFVMLTLYFEFGASRPVLSCGTIDILLWFSFLFGAEAVED
jgi:hypothetical protein